MTTKTNNKPKTTKTTNNKNLKIGNKVLCNLFNSQDKTWDNENFEGIITEIKYNVPSKNPKHYGDFETIYLVHRLDINYVSELHEKEIIQVLNKSQIDYNNHWNTFELFMPDYGMKKQGNFDYCLGCLLEKEKEGLE